MNTMNKKLRNILIAGFLFVSIVGSLMHFVYEWSGNNVLVGLIAPVSESTWEHMKLLFFPMLLYSLFALFKYGKQYPCLASGLSTGILAGTFLIPVLFYTYTGILGTNYLWLDIAVFILSCLAAFVISYYLTINCCFKNYKPLLLIVILLMAVAFFIFTFYPPQFGLFLVP